MYDLVIIGGGPGGYTAAERAGQAGLKTLLIEKAELGGTCLNRGCIPTKSLLNAAKAYHYAHDSAKLGVTAENVRFDLQTAMAWKNDGVGKLRQGIAFLMKKHSIEVETGTASFESAHSVRIAESGRVVEAKHVIIASGSVPAVPPIPGVAGNESCMTSDQLLFIEKMPASIVIVGGGVIGMEFACFFSLLGVAVTVVEMLPEILPFMDKEAVGIFKRSFRGIKFATSAKVEKVEGGTVHFSTEAGADSVKGDIVLIATGRKAVHDSLGLDKAGVAFERRGITVDESMRTNVEGLYAIGDVTGRSLLAHSAEAMARVAVDTILGKRAAINWNAIPWVVYTSPDAAGVGMTEDDVKAKGIDYLKAVIPARANGRFVMEQGQTAHGCAKIIAEKGTGKILGITLVHPYAGESIWGAVNAIERGTTIAELADMVFPHPTISELILEACKELASCHS